jgi:hypothetical protein
MSQSNSYAARYIKSLFKSIALASTCALFELKSQITVTNFTALDQNVNPNPAASDSLHDKNVRIELISRTKVACKLLIKIADIVYGFHRKHMQIGIEDGDEGVDKYDDDTNLQRIDEENCVEVGGSFLDSEISSEGSNEIFGEGSKRRKKTRRGRGKKRRAR